MKSDKSKLPDKQQADETTFQELASLTPIEYDRCRQNKADELGIRVGTLDTEVELFRSKFLPDSDNNGNDFEPWPEPVDGLALIEEVYRIIKDHCIISDLSAVAISLWVMLTYSYDAFRILPILTLISPVKRCGKTTLLSVLQGLVCKGMMASNISPAATYRSIEAFNPTLLADEADTFFKHNEELRGVFNSGHCKESAYIIRCDGDSNNPVMFSTWGPKAIAMISSLTKLPDTIADRSIVVEMSRKTAVEKVLRKSITFYDDSQILRRKLLRWGLDAMPELQKTEINLPNLGNDRMTDNWLPLATIAYLLYEDWYNKAIEAMRELSGYHIDADDSANIMALEDIRHVFTEQQVDRLSSEEIVNHLIALDDRPWPEWRQGKPLTKNGLARLLKPFSIKTKKIRFPQGSLQGYRLDQFSESFYRYLPPDQNGTPEQISKINTLHVFQNGTGKYCVPDKNNGNCLKSRDCSIVPPQKGSLEEGYKRKELKL